MQLSQVHYFGLSLAVLLHNPEHDKNICTFVTSVNAILLSSVRRNSEIGPRSGVKKNMVDRSVVVCDFLLISQVSLPVYLRVTVRDAGCYECHLGIGVKMEL
jgi:hypothetical protein